MLFLVDGLDECDEEPRRLLLNRLVDTLGHVHESRTSDLARFRIAIVSRPISGLQGTTTVKLDPDYNEKVASDVQHFIEIRVRQLSGIAGLDDELRTKIKHSLLVQSEGTFLWVGFAMHELAQKQTRVEVLETLSSLPRGLPATYGRILLKIQQKGRHNSKAILKWVTMAARPLQLSELAAAIGVESSTHLTAQEAIRNAVTLCEPLLRIDSDDGTVAFVHQSARDFLVNIGSEQLPSLEWFVLDAQTVHLELARSCLGCIERSDLFVDTKERLSYDSGEPLSSYACKHWPEHGKASGRLGTSLLDEFPKYFAEISSVRDRWWQLYTKTTFRCAIPPLHLASHLGILPLVEAMFSKQNWLRRKSGVFMNKKDEHGMTALYLAARAGNAAVCQYLLDHGADHSRRIGSLGQTALDTAADNGHTEVVQLLLDNKKSAIRSLDRALPRVAAGGHEKTLRLLLHRGINVDSRDTHGETALMTSTDHPTITQLLLDYGADVNAKDKRHWTALMSAARHGNTSVLELLLSRGADMTATIWRGMTALTLAIAEHKSACVKLLLAKGANVHPQKSERRGILSFAVYLGHVDIVEMLLSHGANVELLTWESGATAVENALCIAARLGHVAILTRLLDHGAKVNACPSDPALHRAARSGCKEAVEILLERGADVNLADASGNTALLIAV